MSDERANYHEAACCSSPKVYNTCYHWPKQDGWWPTSHLQRLRTRKNTEEPHIKPHHQRHSTRSSGQRDGTTERTLLPIRWSHEETPRNKTPQEHETTQIRNKGGLPLFNSSAHFSEITQVLTLGNVDNIHHREPTTTSRAKQPSSLHVRAQAFSCT